MGTGDHNAEVRVVILRWTSILFRDRLRAAVIFLWDSGARTIPKKNNDSWQSIKGSSSNVPIVASCWA